MTMVPSMFLWNTRAALKVMPCILWCWPTTSEADVGDTAVEAEPAHQYSITFCYCVTDGSREAIWQNCTWHGSAYGAKVWNWLPSCRKKWHTLTFVVAFWMFLETKEWMWAHRGGGWCISTMETTVVTSAGADLYECAMQASSLMKRHS